MNNQRRSRITAPRYTPLWGVLVGALAGAAYWLSAQIWPTSVAVVMAMVTTELLCSWPRMGDSPRAADSSMVRVFMVLVRYNALMALSAANMPFALPGNVALGLIMIAGQAASRSLVVSVRATTSTSAPRQVSQSDLGVALLLGFAPAALIGLPGLIGLVAAIAARQATAAYARRNRPAGTGVDFNLVQQLTEACFYLGALAAWAYI